MKALTAWATREPRVARSGEPLPRRLTPVLLDGVRIPDFRALDDIDAQSILVIYIYSGIEGTTYYGTNSVSGVILIKTKDGQS